MSKLSDINNALSKVVKAQIAEYLDYKHRNSEPEPPSSCYCNVGNAPCSWCTRTYCDTCGEDVDSEDEQAFEDYGDHFTLTCRECREERVITD